MIGENIVEIREAISAEEVSPTDPGLNSTMCSMCRIEPDWCSVEEHPGRGKHGKYHIRDLQGT